MLRFTLSARVPCPSTGASQRQMVPRPVEGGRIRAVAAARVVEPAVPRAEVDAVEAAPGRDVVRAALAPDAAAEAPGRGAAAGAAAPAVEGAAEAEVARPRPASVMTM